MKTIDEVIAEMYAQVSFERGERHGLDRQSEIFAPNARMVRVTDDAMVSFWEGELITRGVNSIQMFQRSGDWWISAMIWRREGKSVRP